MAIDYKCYKCGNVSNDTAYWSSDIKYDGLCKNCYTEARLIDVLDHKPYPGTKEWREKEPETVKAIETQRAELVENRDASVYLCKGSNVTSSRHWREIDSAVIICICKECQQTVIGYKDRNYFLCVEHMVRPQGQRCSAWRNRGETELCNGAIYDDHYLCYWCRENT